MKGFPVTIRVGKPNDRFYDFFTAMGYEWEEDGNGLVTLTSPEEKKLLGLPFMVTLDAVRNPQTQKSFAKVTNVTTWEDGEKLTADVLGKALADLNF